MKALIAALAMIVATPAFATSLKMEEEIVFQSVEIDGQETKLTGIVTLNLFDHEATVRLYNDRCGSLVPSEPGTYHCLAMPTLAGEFTVKIQVKKDECGSVIYSGREDRRPVDGAMTQITVADHRERICENVVGELIEAQVFSAHLRAPHPTIYSLKKAVIKTPVL